MTCMGAAALSVIFPVELGAQSIEEDGESLVEFGVAVVVREDWTQFQAMVLPSIRAPGPALPAVEK